MIPTFHLASSFVVSFAAAMLLPAALVARAAHELVGVRRAIRERRARRAGRADHAG